MLYPVSKFLPDSADMIIGFINSRGELKVGHSFLAAGHFCEGKASVVIASGYSGFLDLTGQLVIPAGFRGISHFHDGVCTAGDDLVIGYIDHGGKWLIRPRFLIAMEFSEGRAFVSDDGESFRLIDAAGAAISKDRYERAQPFRAGLAPVMRDGRWGYIDKQGKTAIPFMFEDVQRQHFKCGLAAAKVTGRWGFIDHTGFFAINPRYEEVLPFSEGLAPVRIEQKWGFLDHGGRMRLTPAWDEVGQFVNGLANAQLGGKWGYINPAGTWSIQPAFDEANPFFGELAIVEADGAPAYVRADGKIVWTFEQSAIVPRPPMAF